MQCSKFIFGVLKLAEVLPETPESFVIARRAAPRQSMLPVGNLDCRVALIQSLSKDASSQ